MIYPKRHSQQVRGGDRGGGGGAMDSQLSALLTQDPASASQLFADGCVYVDPVTVNSPVGAWFSD